MTIGTGTTLSQEVALDRIYEETYRRVRRFFEHEVCISVATADRIAAEVAEEAVEIAEDDHERSER